MEKLENYISKEEISQPRSPKDFIDWFEEKLEITKKLREKLEMQNILHRGRAKIFYEELFPLYRLLQNKRKDWRSAKLTPIIGNQNYDVEVKTCRTDVPKYIEITITDMDEKAIARWKSFASGQGDTGLSGFADELYRQGIDKIKRAIEQKVKKGKRPDNTALLVYIDDYEIFPYFKEEPKKEIDSFLCLLDIQWQSKFKFLYLVGISGNSFWERH